MKLTMAFFALMIASCFSSQEISYMTSSEQATFYLSGLVRTSSVPGVQYAVIDSNGTIFEFAGGWADIEQRIPMSLESPMMAYSMTKTLTAAAVMRLVDAGRLDLDESANNFLKHNPYGKSITIRQLLTHTSGIPNPIPLRWVHPASDQWDRKNYRTVLESVLTDHAELDFKPGEERSYSNIGYWLLGEIVETASGTSYEQYLQDEIFRPLGLSEREMGFAFPVSAPRTKGYLARWSLMNFLKYFFIDSSLIGEYEDGWLHIRSHYVNGPAFGGIIGTARGFASFLRDQLRSRSALFRTGTQKAFFEPQRTNSGKASGMTPGWHIGTIDGHRYFFKEGGGGGFHSEMRIYAEKGIGSVIMVNETSAKARDYITKLDQFFIN